MGMQVAVDNLQRIRDAASPAAAAAARAMAKQGQHLDREILTAVWHPPFTKTPSPPGQPPAAITGTLARSIFAGDPEPIGAFSWVAHAGPTAEASSYNGPYGRFLEFGGTHVQHNSSGYMHWFEDGVWHHRAVIGKDSRDYLIRAILLGVADGTLNEAAVGA